MRKLLVICLSFLLMSACGSADDYIDDYDDIKVIVADPPSHKDSINNNPSDTIILGKDSTVVSKEYVICSFREYMILSPTYGTGQGGACYDKYFFQGYQNNSAIGIYDLVKKKSLGRLGITNPTPNSMIHSNTLNFGMQRYNKDDFFPLLYVSSGYPKNVNGKSLSFIYVYRISKSTNINGEEEFGITLIQTISLKGFGYWTEGILDNEHNILWLKYEPGGEYRYASFYVPKYDVGDVEISLEDNLVDFSIGKQPFSSSNQGHLYYNDRILLVSGTNPYTQKLAFIVINTITQSRELVIDLAEIGLREEPENLFFFRNQLMIGYRNSIYEFNIKYVH